MVPILAIGLALLSGAAGAAHGWVELPLDGVEKPTIYRWDSEQGVWRASTRCSASALVLALDSVDLSQTPRLRWRWRVLQGFANPAEREKAGDDFAARVSVFFRNRHSSLLETARARILRSLHGREVPDRYLIFVWAHAEQTGASWRNPYAPSRSHVEVAQHSAPSTEWRVEVVDIEAALHRAFGARKRDVTAIGILSDSDNRCQRAVAEYADFEWLPPEP